jgi:hypothetical protein
MILSGLTGIKRISPVSWKHVNFYGKYIFRDTGNLLPASGRDPANPLTSSERRS